MAGEGTEAEKLRFGEEIRIGDPKWVQFLPEVGQILEVVLTPGDAIKEEAKIAILVTEVKEESDGELIYVGRFVGSENEEIGKYCSTYINRKELGVHICRENPCPGVASKVAGHVMRGAIWEASAFDADYMKAWGRMVIKEYVEKRTIKRRKAPTREEDPDTSGGRKKKTPKTPAGGEPSKSTRKDGKEKKDKKDKKEKKHKKSSESEEGSGVGASGTQKDRGNVAGLTAKLVALRKRLDGHGRDEQEEIIYYRCRFLARARGARGVLALCGGTPIERIGDRRPPGIQSVPACSGRRREARGYKRWYLEQEEEESESEEKSQSFKENGHSKPASGSCRGATEGERKRKEEGQKQEAIRKGKGFGESLRKQEGEEEIEGEGRSRSIEQREFGRGQQRGWKQFINLRYAGTTSEEKPSSTRSSAEDAHQACSADSRPDVSGRGEGWRHDHARCEDGNVLQPADSSLPPHQQPGHEGASLPQHLHRRASKWQAGSSWGQPGVEVLGGSQCGERGGVEDSTALRTPPLGRSSECADTSAIAGTEAFEADCQKPRTRRAGEGMEKRRLEERRLERPQGQRKRSKRRKRPLRQGERTWQLWQAGRLAVLEPRRRWRQVRLVGQEQGEAGKGRLKGKERRQVTRRSQEKKDEYKRGEEASQDEERKKERSYEGSYKKGEEALQRREERERDEENKDPPCLNWGRGFEFVANLAEVGSDLATLGCAMAWMVVQAEKHRRMSGRSKSLWSFLAGPFAGSTAVHRPLKKRTFPIRLGRWGNSGRLLKTVA